MKTLKGALLLIMIIISSSANAQFLKNLKKRAEEAAKETITQKVENKTSEKTGEAMDTILNTDEKIKTKHRKKRRKNDTDGTNGDDEDQLSSDNSHRVRSNLDFVAGSRVIYSDTFKNDAIADFPVTWNTNSSGEVVTFDDDDTRWLQLDLGQYTPDGITQIPENCTFEFDLTVSENFDWYSDGLWVNLVEVKDRRKDFAKWSRFSAGENGVRLRLKPKNFEYTGETSIQTYADNSVLLDNLKNTDQFTLDNNIVVHVALWRQKNRLRVYLNDEKVWDIPRAFSNANYNSITFNTAGSEEEHFFISNLRLAIAGEDTRHPLLETGRFETNEILFDVNKAIIKPGSYKILDDLGKVLEENPGISIKIIGHTDSDGDATSNQLLSEKRALAIKDYLSNNFPIAGKRMQVIGKGESEPVADNKTTEGKAKNRRVEFIKIN